MMRKEDGGCATMLCYRNYLYIIIVYYMGKDDVLQTPYIQFK